jgi:hypothetical protein
MRLNVHDAFLNAGGDVRINLSVANTGEATWAETVRAGDDGEARRRETRVVATWVLLDPPPGETGRTRPKGAATGAGEDSGVEPDAAQTPLVVELRAVPLAPGRMVRISRGLAVPDQVGHWALVMDIVDDISGSFAGLGSAPEVALFEVVPPRGIEVVE